MASALEMASSAAVNIVIPTQSQADIGPELYRFSVDEYERITAAGALDDNRVELIDGLVVRKMPKNSPHIWGLDSLDEVIRTLLPTGYTFRRESPIGLSDSTMPEPDVAIVRGSRLDYQRRHPIAAETVLMVEVSESSLSFDRGAKLVAYARAGIPAYWIVNLVERCIEAYTEPTPSGYSRCDLHAENDSIMFEVDGQELGRIAVAGLLPMA